MKSVYLIALLFTLHHLSAQPFYFGADLSYVNEMEDCGVVYKEQGVAKDPYQIFAGNQCNLVRLRLWHTPAWYDTLNAGKRYSDFQDVRKSIMRAKAAGMKVLLDFHLSDTWADPNSQLAPAAWQGVVNNLPLLKDSLYNYISGTLLALNTEDLLPDMVQIGNETNKGILLSAAANAGGWTLDWNRNSQLFKRAIEAVRDVETATGKNVKVALHVAGPADAGWLMQGFWNNGVTDFDVIGLSYYWAWHKPTTIADAGNVITQLGQQYPGKEVIIFETGYIWTTQGNDNANNIISEVHPDYSPASPANQKKWLIDLTQEVINKGGKGVIYWEPAWVSSPCWTPWGQGSHQEHATYFDFNNNVLSDGGIHFMKHPYNNLVAVDELTPDRGGRLDIRWTGNTNQLVIRLNRMFPNDSSTVRVHVSDRSGKLVSVAQFYDAPPERSVFEVQLDPLLPLGVYYVAVFEKDEWAGVKGVVFGK
ncbi:MAG: glycosyl hydrolase 53 family protein [Lewinellaceae bacterium]|nr:glycosyl hydrolase 53 family protein [Lewinellaceae bacterium]